ncbi:hypothetical protein [Saccharibacillus alkalitolerans]|uniref:B box-type domain-containing protein n=1 Tax=Saccharibacillus alkalitolerans TaxID=2705290 RepID=A0ABX0F4Q9_9BACL|nr:hypothetical protein [Saccharibacillus alkalitolerans]NGZ74549.1 hypothetical protein [Saccharibacillus alkalitolerans]
MLQPYCAYHPEREARHQCTRCGRMICDECYDPESKTCRFADCHIKDSAGAGGRAEERGTQHRNRPNQGDWSANTGCRIVVAIFAIIGGLFLLLLAICGGMIFLNY